MAPNPALPSPPSREDLTSLCTVAERYVPSAVQFGSPGARAGQPRLLTQVSPSLLLFDPSGQMVSDQITLVRLALDRLAPVRLAKVRSALVRLASARSVPARL